MINIQNYKINSQRDSALKSAPPRNAFALPILRSKTMGRSLEAADISVGNGDALHAHPRPRFPQAFMTDAEQEDGASSDFVNTANTSELTTKNMLPPVACKRMQAWIRSRHLICSGNFFIFETLEYSTIERFEECVRGLGGTFISVEPLRKVWIGNHRQVLLYQAKASLHTPHHELKQYWIKYGGFYTRFDERAC